MLKLKVKIFCFISLLFIILFVWIYGKQKSYSVTMEFFTENGSHVEYPQIKNLKDKKKQKRINEILKEQIYLGAKDSLLEPFVDFSNPRYVYDFKVEVGYTDQYIASFLYSFFAHGFDGPDDKYHQHNSRNYGVTIDMETGEKLELSKFMIIDERLIDSTDGSGKETNYDSPAYDYHTFKDLYYVYTSEKEKDNFHQYTMQDIIEQLNSSIRETMWYIDKDKNIVFYRGDASLRIPYTELEEIIYPSYLEDLRK